MGSSIVGLDLGTSQVRAAQVRRRRDGSLEVTRAAAVDLPHGAIRLGAIEDPRAVSRALRTLWRRGRFTTRRVAFALNDGGVLTRQMDLPWMPPKDFAAALRFQVGDALPVDLATVEIGYHLLEEIPRTDDLGNPAPINRILLVAANREAIEAQAAVLRRARLEPVRADSSAFALIRAACSGRLPADQRPMATADIGASQLTVVIHQAGQPRFIRTIANLGGDTATSSLVDRLDMDWDTAERIKRETGLNGPVPIVAPVAESSVFGSVAAEAPPDPRVLATIGVLNPWATTIVNEIRNSLDYYQASMPGAPIAGLTLAGRTVLLDGLSARIATQVPLPLATLPPLAGMTASGRVARHAPADTRLAVALGMASPVST
jgi:type IV pilus assembly protein PilM